MAVSSQVRAAIMNYRRYLKAVLCVLMVLILSSSCGRKQTETIHLKEDTDQGIQDVSQEEKTTSDVSVYVCGSVKTPGVYTLTKDSRICDAISAAGGALDEADAQILNQAAPLSDGMRIYVPSVKETADLDRSSPDGADTAAGEKVGTASSDASASRVNINTAGKDELMTLTGIGESKAQSILDYRQQQGPFASVEDIMNVAGIKQGVFDKIRDQITV